MQRSILRACDYSMSSTSTLQSATCLGIRQLRCEGAIAWARCAFASSVQLTPSLVRAKNQDCSSGTPAVDWLERLADAPIQLDRIRHLKSKTDTHWRVAYTTIMSDTANETLTILARRCTLMRACRRRSAMRLYPASRGPAASRMLKISVAVLWQINKCFKALLFSK